MRQFLAIQKDSFREAMDAKVIWVLLALSALVCLITFSISFTPDPPEQAFQRIGGRFIAVFPDRGKGKLPVLLGNSIAYSITNVKPTGNGYTLRLTAKPSGTTTVNFVPGRHSHEGKQENGKQENPAPATDPLRFAVVNWQKPPGKERSFAFDGMRAMEGVEPNGVTPEETAALTDQDLCTFVEQQFAINAGMPDVSAKRVTDDVKEPTYVFDVAIHSSDSVRGWPTTTKLFFGGVTISHEAPLGFMLFKIEDEVINGVGAGLTLLIGVIITGFFIPNMLRKGALDLLITKPIGRTSLLIYKYIGGLSYMLILSVVTIGGVWFVLALRSGYWDPTFLLLIPILTFTFAILYACSTFIAVLTRSAIAAILVTCGFAVFLWVFGHGKMFLDNMRADPNQSGEVNHTLADIVDAVHFVLPRYKDVDRLTTKLIADGTLTPIEQYATAKSKIEYPSWADTFGGSTAFIAVMLALACWRLNTRDS